MDGDAIYYQLVAGFSFSLQISLNGRSSGTVPTGHMAQYINNRVRALRFQDYVMFLERARWKTDGKTDVGLWKSPGLMYGDAELVIL